MRKRVNYWPIAEFCRTSARSGRRIQGYRVRFVAAVRRDPARQDPANGIHQAAFSGAVRTKYESRFAVEWKIERFAQRGNATDGFAAQTIQPPPRDGSVLRSCRWVTFGL